MAMRDVWCLVGDVALAAAVAGCGGPAFDVAGDDSGSANSGGTDSASAATDTGAGDGASARDASGDVGSFSTDGSSGEAEASAPCAPLSSSAADVYVDQRFAGMPQYGAAACPFTTIAQGTAAAANLSGAVTVHVAGATPALVYKEASVITVGANVDLLGSGSASTTIQANGACASASGTCAVIVSAGAIVDGFTITDSSGDGILAMAGASAPTIRNTAANGNKGWGIIAGGGVELGPNFSANSNGTGGLESPTTASGRIHVIGTANAFNDNGAGNGINVDGPAFLLFEGGTANGNGQGIRLAGTPGPAGSLHAITNLTATGNTGPGGLVAYDGQTITLRSSTLLGNTSVGLVYNYVNGSTLDIGSAAAGGGNVFGGATASTRNGKAGMRLCAVPATVTAAGDSWSSCPPMQTLVACSGTLPATYSDIQYDPAAATTTSPVTAASCTTGP
jgi:hypothetical protein